MLEAFDYVRNVRKKVSPSLIFYEQQVKLKEIQKRSQKRSLEKEFDKMIDKGLTVSSYKIVNEVNLRRLKVETISEVKVYLYFE